MESKNRVDLAGKVSKVREVKYTPSGACLRELVLAVHHDAQLEKPSMGYFEIVFSGEIAQQKLNGVKIGDWVEVTGSLWNRSFKNREGVSINETKIIAETLKHETH